MAKKIVYIHPGDMIEVRFCPEGEEATAAGFKQQTRGSHQIVSFPRYNEIEVFDIFALVFEGTGESRRQMLARTD